MGVFYNKAVDQIAMTCQICDNVRNQLSEIRDDDIEWYGEHLRAQHGMEA